MSLLVAAGIGAMAAGGAMTAFGGSDPYQSFTPPSYDYERNTINPMMWGQLGGQMAGQPSQADVQMRTALMKSISQNYKDSLNMAGSDYAGRGVFDSGWMGQKQGQLLGQRAQMESEATNQMWQNILARQMAAQGMTSNYLAGARAGSGTYTQRG